MVQDAGVAHARRREVAQMVDGVGARCEVGSPMDSEATEAAEEDEGVVDRRHGSSHR